MGQERPKPAWPGCQPDHGHQQPRRVPSKVTLLHWYPTIYCVNRVCLVDTHTIATTLLLSLSATDDRVVHLATGRHHCVVATESGAVYSWGARQHIEPVKMSVLDGVRCVQVAAGDDYSAALSGNIAVGHSIVLCREAVLAAHTCTNTCRCCSGVVQIPVCCTPGARPSTVAPWAMARTWVRSNHVLLISLLTWTFPSHSTLVSLNTPCAAQPSLSPSPTGLRHQHSVALGSKHTAVITGPPAAPEPLDADPESSSA